MLGLLCFSFLEKEMDPSNCLGIHCFAEAHACIPLSEKVNQMNEFVVELLIRLKFCFFIDCLKYHLFGKENIRCFCDNSRHAITPWSTLQRL